MRIFDEMLSVYEIKTQEDKRNAIHEVSQQIALAGLYRAGFFEHAAFYGGTCLRIFHGLERFSEDLDFTLLKKDADFDITQYFQALETEFDVMGRKIEITKKNKTKTSQIESAFLKDQTEVYNIKFRTEKSIKIKLEVDTNPPLKFSSEQKLLLQPYSMMIPCLTLPDLFAGKLHAFLFRSWKNRVKGRDWYDLEWYIRKQIPLNFEHFVERAKQSGLKENEKINQEILIQKLKNKIDKTAINAVKQDVIPFIKNPKDLEIWSKDYFMQLVDLIKFI